MPTKKTKEEWKLPKEFPWARRYRVDGIDRWVGGYAICDRPFKGKSFKHLPHAKVMCDRAGRFIRIPLADLRLAKDCPKVEAFEDVYVVTKSGTAILGGEVDTEARAEVEALALGTTAIKEETIEI